jgi:hypothetical protein
MKDKHEACLRFNASPLPGAVCVRPMIT